jgi:signal transduction histidine kinase
MRVLLVDDHAPIRKGLRRMLETRPGFEVVAEGANGAEAIDCVEEHRPDIVLMDMNMPVMNGAEATRVIKERHPEVQVVGLTAFGDMSLVSAMVKAGAAGYLLKGGSSEELVDSLNAVAAGQGALDREVTRGVMDDLVVLYQKEQERSQALAELDRMKSEFVSVVSHELRTPLTSIKGGITTLNRGWHDIDEDVKLEFLDSIAKQCDRLTRMVGQILMVSGIQRGGLGLRPSIFSLADVARESLSLLDSRAQSRDIDLDMAEVKATGDRERIKEVAVALIENALMFTTGNITIRVLNSGDRARLEVSDEGPGLDEQTLSQLLTQPFVQADSSSTRRVGGLGLSLYIARQVLEASGGELQVDTSPESGSTFAMVLEAA